jgi:hypothetical protein
MYEVDRRQQHIVEAQRLSKPVTVEQLSRMQRMACRVLFIHASPKAAPVPPGYGGTGAVVCRS